MKKIILFLILIAWTTFALSGMKMRIKDSTAIKDFSDQKIELKIINLKFRGFNLHYVKVGSDTLPTLFFVHGSPGSWDAFKAYLLDADLINKFRMIAIDRPGFGYSDFGEALSLDDQSKLISKCIKQELNNKPFHLIGHSIGGPVIVKLAQMHPEYYASLVILAGSISPYLEPKEPMRYVFKTIPLRFLIPGAFRPSNTEIISFKKELYSLDSNYSNLQMPILFIHGNKDPLVSVKNVDYGLSKLKTNTHVTKIILDGANHFIPWQHFGEIKKQLLNLATR